MSTHLFAHSRGEAQKEVPSIIVNENDGYASVNFEQGDNQVSFFVHKKDGESMDDLIVRVARELCPKFELKQNA